MASTINSKPLFVIMLGPPASGKSTVVKAILAGNPNLRRFVVRRQLAEERRNGTDLWLAAARASAEKGAWIPDAVVVEMLARRLPDDESTGMLIEGLPANAEQAVRVRNLLETRGAALRRILYLDAPDGVCAARVRNRRVCASCDDGMAPARPDPAAPDRCASCAAPLTRRHDDDGARFLERLAVHRRNIGAVLAAYPPEEVVVVDAARSPAAVAAAATYALSME